MTPGNTKYEHNWKSKALENLEKDYWADPTYDSHLVKRCHLLRKKPLEDFGTEDLRIMIGQNIGLKYLIPLALETLKDNIFAEGDCFEGDLLKSVLSCDKQFWKNETDLLEKLEEIIQENEQSLNERGPALLGAFNELKRSST